VVTVTLAAQALAAPAGWRALGAVADALDRDVRAVVVRGADAHSLDAAANGVAMARHVLRGLSDADADAQAAAWQEAVAWLARPALVSIAALRGRVSGEALQVALACDLRVVASDTSFAMTDTVDHQTPFLGGSGRLAALVGEARALEIALTGRRVDAAEAVGIGLAELAVVPAELDAATRDLLAAVLVTPRQAAEEAKALLRGAGRRSAAEQDVAERGALLRIARAGHDEGVPEDSRWT
jgi:enoyl-CoA hydratase/carnithine racemase